MDFQHTCGPLTVTDANLALDRLLPSFFPRIFGPGEDEPLYSGVLSAYDLALADVVEEVQEPCFLHYDPRSFSELDRRVDQLTQRCTEALRDRGFSSYLKEFGFTIPDRPIIVDDIRIRGSGKSGLKSMTNTKMGYGFPKATTVQNSGILKVSLIITRTVSLLYCTSQSNVTFFACVYRAVNRHTVCLLCE
ncbi:unnamed protein product [Coregonus sp. 'balchen']|nr:unnamed protein product [Coregonus sp. 'balchen']